MKKHTLFVLHLLIGLLFVLWGVTLRIFLNIIARVVGETVLIGDKAFEYWEDYYWDKRKSIWIKDTLKYKR